MESEVKRTKGREITLDTDWGTALLVAGGLLYVLGVIILDVRRFVYGKWAVAVASTQTVFSRVWDSAFLCFAIFILINFCLKSAERITRFASALLVVGMAIHVLRLWLPLSNPALQILVVSGRIVELPAFILLAIYAVKWFKSKVVHA